MTINNQRFVTRNGLDNNSNSIANIGVTGASLTQVGANSLTLTTTGTTNVTFPTSGTLLTTTGSAASLTSFPTFNQDTTGKSAKTDALNSATTVVNVSSATAPSTGQVLMATSSTAATWQTPAAAFNPAAPGPIGGTTPAAGSFTTLSSGSGGSAAANQQLTLNGSDNVAAGIGIFGKRNSANTWFSGDVAWALGSGTGHITYVYGDNPVIWWINAGEKMRLTSTGLNSTVIGATTPAAGSFTTLSASGTITGTTGINLTAGTAASTATKGLQIRFDTSGSTGHISSSHSGVANYPLFLGGEGNGIGCLYIDAVGSVGLGTNSPATFGTFAIRTATTVSGRAVSASFSDGITGTLEISHASGYVALDTESASIALRIAQNGTNIGVFSSTGLAVTGALSASGVSRIGSATSSATQFTIKQSSTVGLAIQAVSSDSEVLLFHDGTMAIVGASYETGGAYCPLSFQTSSSNRMTIAVDGSITMSSGLAVTGTLSASTNVTAGNFYIGAAAGTFGYADASASIVTTNVSSGTPNLLVFNTSGSEKMRLDASGNLGLGVVPSASNGGRTFEVGYLGCQLRGGGVSDTNVESNTYYSSGFKYAYSGARASRYAQTGGVHQWWVSTDVTQTAGNPITFTQAMTLTAAGNLLVGTTSDNGYKFATVVAPSASFQNAITMTNASDSDLSVRIRTNETSFINSGSTASFTFATNSTERARIDSSGNLGLGVTPSAWYSNRKAFDIGGSVSTITGANITIFGNNYYTDTGGTNRYVNTGAAAQQMMFPQAGGVQWFTAPIDTAGNPITFTQVLTLEADGNLNIRQTSAGLQDINGISLNAQSYSTFNHPTGWGSGNGYLLFGYAGGAIGSITQNGTTAVAYNTTSDHRLKDNVRPANAARFMDIEFVDFEWVDGRHDCGVIADQLQSIYPDLVLGAKDATEVRTVEIAPAVPAVTEQRELTHAVPAVAAVEASEAVVGSPAEYTTVTTEEVVLIDGVETTISRSKIVETKAAVAARDAVAAIEAVAAVEATYETVEVTPAVPAVTEEQTFPVYQQVNYMGLIGRIGTRVQQLQRTVDAQATLIAAMEARLTALEAK